LKVEGKPVTAKIKLLMVDDHAVVREGLKSILSQAPELEVAAEASGVSEALELIRTYHFDVILLDLSLPGQSGMALLQAVKAKTPALPVLILSAQGEDQYGPQALKAGANGYINKECAPEDLISAVRRVACGKKYVSFELADQLASGLTGSNRPAHERLSNREFQVLERLARGESLTKIAAALHMSTKTVTTYRSRILQKTGLTSNAELTRYALGHGLLT
jgi:two-component system, NarL family, invasion response regulator UvrY